MVGNEGREAQALAWLAQLPSSDALEVEIGELDDKEQALLAKVDWSEELSEEELRAFGPGFVNQLMERMFGQTRSRLFGENKEIPGVDALLQRRINASFALLDLLSGIEARAYFQGLSVPKVTEKKAELAVELADELREAGLIGSR